MTAKSKKPKAPQPPAHLSPEARAWYAKVQAEYELDRHHLMMLQAAAESWDRMQTARRVVQKKGLTFINRFAEVRPRPEVQIEKEAKIVFCRIIRELRLDESEPSAAESRLPRLRGAY